MTEQDWFSVSKGLLLCRSSDGTVLVRHRSNSLSGLIDLLLRANTMMLQEWGIVGAGLM